MRRWIGDNVPSLEDTIPELVVFAVLFALVAFGIYALANGPSTKPPTISTKPDCRTQAGLPYDVVVCPDAHAYQITEGRWTDLGRVTPVPQVPRNRPLSRPREGAVEHRFDFIEPYVRRWVGRPIAVYCETMAGDGDYGGNSIDLASVYCRPLRDMLTGIDVVPARQGVGLIALTHEMIHARGTWNEAQTECYAFQLMDNVARGWGVKEPWLSTILAFARANHRQLIHDHPRYAQARKCRANAVWDLSPGDGVWP